MKAIIIHSHDCEGLRAISIVQHLLDNQVHASVVEERLDAESSPLVYLYHWFVSPSRLYHELSAPIIKSFPHDQVDLDSNGAPAYDQFIISVSFSLTRLFEHINCDSFPKLIELTSTTFVKNLIERWEP